MTVGQIPNCALIAAIEILIVREIDGDWALCDQDAIFQDKRRRLTRMVDGGVLWADPRSLDHQYSQATDKSCLGLIF